MLKRILLVWLVANFIIPSIFALLTGGWYLRLPTFTAMAAELVLIILPNFLLPILLLRYAWTEPIVNVRQALGWEWKSWRPIITGLIAFFVYLLLSSFASYILGAGIPYNLPGQSGPINGLAGLLALCAFPAFVIMTVAGEETMFRGLIQTQTGKVYGALAGVLLTVFLFGLRHVPADIFFAHIWNATPGMWLARQVDLYLGAIIFSLARHFGQSAYASATMHFLIFISILAQGFIS